jgi:hypothetical protein
MFYYFEILVLFAVVIFLLIKVIPAGITFMIRLIKGPYSTAYVISYRRSFGKNPYPHAVKDDIIQHLIACSEDGKHHVFETQNDISFDRLNFGLPFQTLRDTLGNPDAYTVQRFENWALLAARYTIGKGEQRIRKIYIFLNDRLVGGELIYPGNNNEQATIIRQKLVEKYSVTLHSDETFKFSIIDKQGNKLIYDATGFNLTLRYGYSNNAELLTALTSFILPIKKNEINPAVSDLSSL